MTTSNNEAKARSILERAKADGCTPKVEGNWVIWTPPLSVELLRECLEPGVNDEIARLMEPNKR